MSRQWTFAHVAFAGSTQLELLGDEAEKAMAIRRPRPRPPKAAPASQTLTAEERKRLASAASYVGSPHHTDIPKYGISKAAPRDGAQRIEDAEAAGLKNPDCLVCPRKWARRLPDVNRLLRSAIEAGTFVSEGPALMPARVWVRDPEDANVVYEAKLCGEPGDYKAYPLTTFQVEYNIPFVMP